MTSTIDEKAFEALCLKTNATNYSRKLYRNLIEVYLEELRKLGVGDVIKD